MNFNYVLKIIRVKNANSCYENIDIWFELSVSIPYAVH